VKSPAGHLILELFLAGRCEPCRVLIPADTASQARPAKHGEDFRGGFFLQCPTYVQPHDKPAEKSWQARIGEATDALAASFVESISIRTAALQARHRRLYRPRTMLAKVGLITDAERDAIIEGWRGHRAGYRSGQFQIRYFNETSTWSRGELIQRIGERGGNCITGRSRNDQVATDLVCGL